MYGVLARFKNKTHRAVPASSDAGTTRSCSAMAFVSQSASLAMFQPGGMPSLSVKSMSSVLASARQRGVAVAFKGRRYAESGSRRSDWSELKRRVSEGELEECEKSWKLGGGTWLILCSVVRLCRGRRLPNVTSRPMPHHMTPSFNTAHLTHKACVSRGMPVVCVWLLQLYTRHLIPVVNRGWRYDAAASVEEGGRG